jgi:hypothetical protein
MNPARTGAVAAVSLLAVLLTSPAHAASERFEGTFGAATCSAFIDFEVPAASAALEVTAAATLPTNDVVLELHRPHGTVVARSDLPLGVEAIHYAPARVVPGTYGVRVCPVPWPPPLPPFTFAGAFTSVALPAVPVGAAPLPRRPPLRATFNPNLLLPTSAGAAEPSIATTSRGVSFVIAPTGLPNGCKAFRVSHDGARATFLGYPDGTVGGGDCDWAIGPRQTAVGSRFDVVAYSSLTGLNLTTGRSDDGGRTFGPPNVISQQLGFDDRQWMAADPKLNDLGYATVYVVYHNLLPGQVELGVSRDGGFTYLQGTPAIDPLTVPYEQWAWAGAGNALGNLVARRDAGGLTLYTIFTTPDSGLDNALQGAAGTYDFNRVYLAIGTVLASETAPIVTWRNYEVWHGPAGARYNQVFPVVAVDAAGRVYAVFTDGRHVLYKSDADGTGWDASESPIELDDVARGYPRRETAVVFPWAAAGGDGMVFLGWYSARGGGESGDRPNDDPANRWHVYLAQTLDAGRSWRAFRASDHVVHEGAACIDGIACHTSAPPRDRTMLDFFQVAIDPTNGAAHVAYMDDHAAPRLAVLYYTRQCTGSNATTGEALVDDCRPPPPPPVPPAPSSCPGPQVTDFTGDAPNGYTAGDGRNMDNFDIVRGAFALPAAGTLRITLTLRDLHAPPPPANLPSASWRVYWDYGGSTYAVEANATSDVVQSYAVGTYDRRTGEFTRIADVRGEFHPGPRGTIVWLVPVEHVGSPSRAATLLRPYADDYGTVELAGTGVRYVRPADRAPDGGDGADALLRCRR